MENIDFGLELLDHKVFFTDLLFEDGDLLGKRLLVGLLGVVGLEGLREVVEFGLEEVGGLVVGVEL